MLFSYQKDTRRLLSDVSFAQYNDFDLRDWINIGRFQVAGEGEALRVLGTLPTVIGQSPYQFASITLPASYGSPVAVRMIGLGGKLLTPRNWEWLFEYYVAPAVGNGPPTDWAQLGQGSAGSFVLGPPPSAIQTMTLDVVATPLPLATDADVEVLPFPFAYAVPYYAAYMALLTTQQFDAAERHYQLYERFVARARAMGTPSVLPEQYLGAAGSRMAAQSTPLTPQSSMAGPGRAAAAPPGGAG